MTQNVPTDSNTCRDTAKQEAFRSRERAGDDRARIFGGCGHSQPSQHGNSVDEVRARDRAKDALEGVSVTVSSRYALNSLRIMMLCRLST
jgi:hypothetical protein